jgi:predicted HicB family RNase H-like nuclease
MNDVLKYKNFIASVKYSDEDEAFIGRVENIPSVVSFEGQSVPELQKAFREAVDSYLDFRERKSKIESPHP